MFVHYFSMKEAQSINVTLFHRLVTFGHNCIYVIHFIHVEMMNTFSANKTNKYGQNTVETLSVTREYN